MLIDFFSSVSTWFPWFTLLSDITILQFLMLYVLYNMFISQNLYYIIFYLVGQIALFGFFLSLYNMELFAAFLWLTEVVVVLVCFFLLFNTTPSGNVNKTIKNIYTYRTAPIVVITFIVSLNYTYWLLPEYGIVNFFVTSMLYDDYYEALSNQNMNDLYGFYISFYIINSVDFIIVGLVLLVGSLAAVQLNRFLKANKSLSYLSFFDIFDYFKDTVKILFLRKQSLVDQENTVSSTRFFHKKVKK